MTTIITIVNQKGGVAKTTTARHLAYFLEKGGVKTLMIDLDHQASLTHYFGLDEVECDEGRGSMSHVVNGEKSITDVMLSLSPNLYVVPAALSLAEAGARLLIEIDGNERIKTALKEVEGMFDVILIDCGPTLDKMLVNALLAASYVLIPVKTDRLSVRGIPALIKTINKVRTMHPALSVLGVLPTLYHKGNLADEKALATLRNEAEGVGVKIFDPIEAATNYDKASDLQQAVFEKFPDTVGRGEYESLANVIANV